MSEIFFDLETCPHACAGDFVPAPDLDSITAAKNLKDPEKVAADLAKRREDATAEHAEKLQRAALDWNLNRIVAIGWMHSDWAVPEPCASMCTNEAQEATALAEFWRAARGHELVGFCARTFDVPTLIQRSRLLRVSYPYVNLSRFGKGDVVDLRDVLTFDDVRYEAIMPRSLKAFCRRFGIPVTDEIDGSQIPALVQAGDWDAVRAHVTSDVRLTAQLAQRLSRAPTGAAVPA